MSALLHVAYKSQYDPDAALSGNDCGPACLAMLLSGLDIAATTDEVFHCTGASPAGFVSMAQLLRAADRYGAPLEFRTGCGLHELRGYLNHGRPLIALVHYGAFSELEPGVSTQSPFTGPHFLLVVGYDARHVVVHDPLWTGERRGEGAFRRWPNAVWERAWATCHLDCNPDGAALISQRSITSIKNKRMRSVDEID